MSYNWSTYTVPSSCTGSARPGTRNMLAYLLKRFKYTSSMGIYSCRLPSEHSQGRALDLGIPTTSGGGARTTLGNPVHQLLGPHGRRLGLTNLIYNRRIYSSASPGGRYYDGASPHYDHAHIGMTLNAANYLTMSTIVNVLGPVDQSPPTTTDWQEKAVASLPTLRNGDGFAGGREQRHVRTAQGLLVARGVAPANTIKPDGSLDGLFGPGTEKAVKRFQSARNLGADGVIGRKTWTELLEA